MVSRRQRAGPGRQGGQGGWWRNWGIPLGGAAPFSPQEHLGEQVQPGSPQAAGRSPCGSQLLLMAPLCERQKGVRETDDFKIGRRAPLALPGTGKANPGGRRDPLQAVQRQWDKQLLEAGVQAPRKCCVPGVIHHWLLPNSQLSTVEERPKPVLEAFKHLLQEAFPWLGSSSVLPRPSETLL